MFIAISLFNCTTMACTSFTIPASPASLTSRTRDIFNKHNRVRRSYSDNHLFYGINHIQAKSTRPNNSHSSEALSSKTLFLIRKPTGESSNDQGKKVKRANWAERLVEIRSKWRNIWQHKEVTDEDNVCGECENDGCGSGGEEDGCAEGCSLEENGEMRYRSYDPESFSRFLVRVPWSDTKLFSQLAFLCNLAYVLPEIKAKDLKKYYGIQFVTSSIERQAEAAVFSASSTMTVVVVATGKGKTKIRKRTFFGHSSSPHLVNGLFVMTSGMDSLASWQACVLFEPTKFEGTNVGVHRGIYEAAKRMYEQFMPEILDHLKRNGEQAKLQFTGHCTGGSIALLVHLMLLTRNVAKPSTLRPVVAFGSPFVFCGGQKLLDQLGLVESDHIHCVMMHRDIVPRAFSCNYTNQVATLLKRLNGSFQSHPCLIKSKMMYSPMGKIFILQPDEMSAPKHPLLPPGSALYALDNTQCGLSSSVLRAFLNCPHPLETLSDPTAYGSEGTVLQDHDSCSYLKAINGVLRQNTRMVVRKVRKQRNLLWPLLTSPFPHSLNDEDESDM